MSYNYTIICHILIPKQGNTIEECEDSYSIVEKKIKNRNKRIGLQIAIADGATESSFAKEWANLLTKSFNNSCYATPLKKHLLFLLPQLRKEWENLMQKKKLPWYAEEKLKQGAFATFLSVRLYIEHQYYHVLGIGDSCLFHISEQQITFQFPITNISDFGNNPYLISSKITKNIDIENYLFEEKKDWKRGDMLFLMSDALSHWFMKQNELQTKPWEILLQLLYAKKNSHDFSQWLAEQWQLKNIKKDDVVLLIIKL